MYLRNVYRQLSMANIIICCAVVFFTATVHAQVRVGLDFATLQENRSSTQVSSVGRTLYDLYLNVGLKKELPLYLTLGYLSVSSVENYDDSTYTKLDSTNAYVGVTYHFWRKNSAGLLVGGHYSPYAKLTVKERDGSEAWNGTAIIGKISGTFNVGKKTKFNAGVYYISESFATRASGSLTTKSSFTQSYLLPAIGVAVEF